MNENNRENLKEQIEPIKSVKETGIGKEIKFEPLKEYELNQEEEWGEPDETESKILRWGGTVALLLIVWGAFSILMPKEKPKREVERVEVKKGKENPKAWFKKQAGTINLKAIHVLRSFVEASTHEEKSKWVRNPKQYLQRAKNNSVNIDVSENNLSTGKWAIGHVKDEGYLVVNTMNSDYMPCRIYMVRSGDDLKIDWSASVAWSSKSLDELRLMQMDGVKSKESFFVRCMIRKKEEFYAASFNEKDYSSYMILSADKMNVMWGYVPRNSELDKKLKKLLNYGDFVVELKKDVRVILQLKLPTKKGFASQIYIEKLITEEWVKP